MRATSISSCGDVSNSAFLTTQHDWTQHELISLKRVTVSLTINLASSEIQEPQALAQLLVPQLLNSLPFNVGVSGTILGGVVSASPLAVVAMVCVGGTIAECVPQLATTARAGGATGRALVSALRHIKRTSVIKRIKDKEGSLKKPSPQFQVSHSLSRNYGDTNLT